MIRRGDEFAIVDADVLGLFLAALTPKRPGALVTVARERGIQDPASLIESMQGDGLLIRFVEDEERSFAALRRLRLQTVGVGLGNDRDEDPETFVIGDHQLRPLLTCDGLTYAIWAASDGRSLGAICDELARSYSMPTERLLRHLLHMLPQLLASRVTFLDAAPRRASS
jgi:hypothetical protein